MSLTKVAIVRDHSGSMSSIRKGAMEDFNNLVDGIKKSSKATKQDTLVSVVECGVRRGINGVNIAIKNENAETVRHLDGYEIYGNTPLFDSVATAIKVLQEDGKDTPADTAFLVMVITDGAENGSRSFNGHSITHLIRDLQWTDKWTFVFRVPRGYKNTILNLGIPPGNVIEWDQTEEGIRESSVATVTSTDAYYGLRSAGQTRSTGFYTDLSNLSITEVKKTLDDITNKVQIVWVPASYNKKQIQEFCVDHFGEYKIGSAYYQLNKSEKVQASKKICIKHKKSGKTYSGADARDLLGIPHVGEIKLSPADHGQYEVFIQSTSVNRHLVGDTRLLYWK